MTTNADRPEEPKKTRRRLTKENVAELRDHLRTLPEKERYSSRDAVREMLPEIENLKEQGYTIIEICEKIQLKGFHMPLPSFRTYLNQVAHGNKRSKKTANSDSRSRSSRKKAPRDTKERDASVGDRTRFAIHDDKDV